MKETSGIRCTCDVSKPVDCLTKTNKIAHNKLVSNLPDKVKKHYAALKFTEQETCRINFAADSLTAEEDVSKTKKLWTSCSEAAVKKDAAAPVMDDTCEMHLVKYLDAKATSTAYSSFIFPGGLVFGLCVAFSFYAGIVGFLIWLYCWVKNRRKEILE